MQFLSFPQRNLLSKNEQITNDFPVHTRKALYCVLSDLIQKEYINGGWESLRNEAYRTGRLDLEDISMDLYFLDFKKVLLEMDWIRVYILCERIYDNLLMDVNTYDINGSIIDTMHTKEELQDKFEHEINILLAEDNIAFEFKDGIFLRRGRAITKKNILRVGSILGDTRLKEARIHYNKALKFFENKDNPDYPNSVKEAICSLELAFEVLTGKNTSKDFAAFIKKYEGNNDDQIPSPIIQSIIKIYGYRGRAEGVAHGISNGLRVSGVEAELVLNITASYITYLYDFFQTRSQEDEIPF